MTTAEILEVRNAGYSESDIVEIITHVGMNILTNIVGKASRVAIDFPKVELKARFVGPESAEVAGGRYCRQSSGLSNRK